MIGLPPGWRMLSRLCWRIEISDQKFAPVILNSKCRWSSCSDVTWIATQVSGMREQGIILPPGATPRP
jgi:hypothetical protein